MIDNNGREAVKSAQTDSNQAEDICPARFFAPSEPANHIIDVAGEKERTMNPLIQSKYTTILPVFIALTLGCFGLSPLARATCREGCFDIQNTVLGENALLNNTGLSNTAIGFAALFSNTTAIGNVATGYDALYRNTTGSANTATGFEALLNNTTAVDNTATGASALASNTTGNTNTATGYQALYSNTTGSDNTANGTAALFSNNGGANTATGFNALYSNTTGGSNTAEGNNSLHNNTTGNTNVAIGESALYSNTTAGSNTATGAYALYLNTTGTQNTANGAAALGLNTSGINNMAVGFFALYFNTTGNSNTALGNNALSANTGNSNIAVGDSAGINLTTGSNNIDIGNKGVAGEANTIRIGKKGTQTATSIAGIRGTTVADGIGVLIDANGRLGTTTSSARFKKDIQAMDKASEVIHSLRPVTFHYKKELDPAGIPQFGLVAEQVAKVNPDLVARDDQGEPYTVRYEAVNAMLLNEFLKEHRKVQEQDGKQKKLEATVAQQKEAIESLIAALKAQAAQIQKVSDQLKTQTVASRVVAND